jgi:hypothetical protein
MVTEQVIVRVANAINLGVDVSEIRDNLLRDGFNDYLVFLAYRAAETYNKMLDVVIVPHD